MRILIFNPPTTPRLPSAAREVSKVINAHPGSVLLQGDDVNEQDLADAIEEGIEDAGFDMIWLVAHCNQDGLHLPNALITAEALTSYVASSGATLVYLNTCSSIYLAQLIVDATHASVIATIADVPDRVAMRTGLLFAKQLATLDDPRQAYEKSKPGQNRTYVYLQNSHTHPGGKKELPETTPGRKKRGAQPGNRNALQHGFYSRQFRIDETNDLDTILTDGLDDEIAMLRVATRRVLELAVDNEDLTTATELLSSLGHASTRLASLLKTKRLIAPDRQHDLTRSISDALAAVVKELQLS